MFVVVIFYLFYVIVKICGGTKREVIPVKYGQELTLYMHPLQSSEHRNFISFCPFYFRLVDFFQVLRHILTGKNIFIT